MRKWIVTISAHGWEDDIDILQFISDTPVSDAEEARLIFNMEYANKEEEELPRDRQLIFPSPFSYNKILGIEKDEDGDYNENDGSRSVYIEIEEIRG